LKHYRIATIPGDGIGPEVIDAATPVLEAAARRFGFVLGFERLPWGADHYLATGETLPEPAFEHLAKNVDAILLGAVGDPRVPGNEHARDILLGLRFRLDLYINLRPVVLWHTDLTPLKAVGRGIDFVIFRENTEGQYTARGRITGDEYVSEEVNTARGVERIIRAAYEWAAANGRSRVTMADKANAIPAHRIWQETFRKVAAEYSGIAAEHRYVDALALELVREPWRFEVIVTNNLYGDILSDLGAGLVGGLGLAGSANLHPGRVGLFEPVHGSAPPLAGKNLANPCAAVLTGALMLRDLGEAGAALALEAAVRAALGAGIRTADLGGTHGTREVAAWLAADVAGPAGSP
jgi:3-isopropylmalate dehydrogenase